MSTSADTVGAARVDDSVVAAAADRLITAATTGRPCAPLRELIGPDDVGTAYRIQERFNAARRAQGVTVVGRKIGATSQAVQQQLGVDQPDFGVLFSDMAYSDGDEIDIARLLQPKAEAEVAFFLAEDLAEGPLDLAQCRAAVGWATAALEIVDSRITDWDISFADTVADNASSGVYVLGAARVTLDEFEPVEVTMSMSIDGEVVSTGNGAACLGDPLNALAWLAQKAREFGEPLRKGQVILSGALGPMRPLHPGATVVATIDGVGAVSASFSTTSEVPSE
ncbi:fumarylacetoacetate hydrolase family protein [Nocardia higoensis]|uniref:Fumarylacetoacetate hydrolase family protein n=1 Tax=Nocardia higoensis TaxID=228599 RepID=A0ABS0D6S7_9NOCA|nr:fumarylacetoacetate hydrolase family protein [Nocardia higoensis]MBF6354189.1 fumarylacetoacetate hydrolase family protein [Nocardia higoensis]